MNQNFPKPFDRRRLVMAALMFVVFLASLKVGSLYPDYTAAIGFGCCLVQLLLVLSYYNRQT